MRTILSVGYLLCAAIAVGVMPGCASLNESKNHFSIEVEHVSAAMDKQVISVRGYIKTDVLGSTYLFANKHNADVGDFTSGLDVVLSHNPRSRADLAAGFCAVVEGVFEARNPENIYLGNFSSHTGLIRPTSIRRSTCPSR